MTAPKAPKTSLFKGDELSTVTPAQAPLSSRDVLAGALAVKFALLRPEELVTTLTGWEKDRSRPLRDLLTDRLGDRWVKLAGEADRALSGGPVTFTEDEACPMPRPAGHCRFNRLTLEGTVGLRANWLAYDDELGRIVAFREIQEHEPLNTAALDRFIYETQVTASLEHPGIPPVYGMGRHPDGRPYCATRHLQGETLDAAIRRHHEPAPNAVEQKQDLGELLTRFVAVCNTVAYAHSRGVTHRDLRPSAIVLGPHDETTVTDWGNARCDDKKDDTLPGTKDRTFHGTAPYAAPEMLQGRHELVGPRSDVYSLGVILHQILTGQAPTDPDASPRKVNARVNAALDAICKKATASDHTRRHESADALADEVRRYLGNPKKSPLTSGAVQMPGGGKKVSLILAGVAGLVAAALCLPLGWYLGSLGNKPDASGTQVVALEDEVKSLKKTLDDRERQLKLLNDDASEAGRKMAAEEIRQLNNKLQTAEDARKKAEQSLAQAQGQGGDAEAKKAISKLKAALADAQATAEQKSLDLQRKVRSEQALREKFTELEKRYDQVVKGGKIAPPTVSDAEFVAGRKAIDDAYTLAREDPFLQRQSLAQTREKLLTKALTFYEALSPRKPDVKADLLHRIAFITGEIATLNKQELAETLQKYETARQAYLELTKNESKVSAHKARLAAVTDESGVYQRLAKKLKESAQTHEEARKLFEELVRDEPKVPAHKAGLAKVWGHLAGLSALDRDNKVALERRQKAKEVYEQLVADHPRVPEYRADLARTYNQIGVLLSNSGKPDDALKNYEGAIDLFTVLVKEQPDVQAHKAQLALISANLANRLRLAKKYKEAVEVVNKALPSLITLRNQEPENLSFRAFLLNAYKLRAFASGGLNRYADSAADLKEAIALEADEDAQRTLRCQRVLALALNNEAKMAVAEGQVVARDKSLDGDQLLSLARAFSVAINAIPSDSTIPQDQRKKNADDWGREGVDLLNRAKEAGAFKEERNRNAVRYSDNFEALRKQPEGKKLINSLPED